MHSEITAKRDVIADLCRHCGVARLEIFGSAVHDADFDLARSDAASEPAGGLRQLSTFHGS
jgi:predicted nucleotidyltransferase